MQVIKYNAKNGYLIRSNNRNDEFYVPPYLLNQHIRKPWTFRFGKMPHRRSTVVETPDPLSTNVAVDNDVELPDFAEKFQDLTVELGAKAIFQAKLRYGARNCTVSWKKLSPTPFSIVSSSKYSCKYIPDDGAIIFVIFQCRLSDSGTSMVKMFCKYV